MGKAFRFFISHSSQTKELARHIYYQSIFNNASVWYDEHLLERGDNIKEHLRQGIEDSDAFLLLHSKPAMESEWVTYEMDVAEQRSRLDKSFRRIAIKLDDEPLLDSWKPFLYTSWNNNDLAGSLFGVLSDIIGKKPVITLGSTALLNADHFRLFENHSGTIAEHSRNYVLYYLAHVKHLIAALSQHGHVDEMQDSLKKILQLSLFEHIPLLHGGIFPIEPGVYEFVFANRMRIPPKITLNALPERYSYSVLTNTEISCKVAILDAETKEIIRYPVPISFSCAADTRL